MNIAKIPVPSLAESFDFAHHKITIATSFALTSFQFFLDKFIFNHSEFVIAIIFATIADTITGIWKSWKLKVFSSYKLGGVFTKAIIYALFLVVVGGLDRIENDIVKGVAQFCYIAILARELFSLVENIEVIRPGTFPKRLIKHLKDFDETGQYKGANE